MPAPRALTRDEEQHVWELWLRRFPQTRIARQFGVSRKVVGGTIARMQAELAEGRHATLEAARDEALATYDVIQQEAWARMAKCAPNSTASVGYLGAILETRRQKDRLLGLEKLQIDHRHVLAAKVDAWLNSEIEAPWLEQVQRPVEGAGEVCDGNPSGQV
jgi:hypothetical protein